MPSKKNTKIAAILLAAGESSRLESPKQLLNWGDDHLINHSIGIIHASRIDRLYVVLGSRYKEISRIIDHKDAVVLKNGDWKKGLSSSIKTGISALSDEIEAVLILLVDQPFISSELIDQILEKSQQTGAKIIAPRVGDQQCNPVLFKRELFPELLNLSGDKGAKALLKEYPVEWVDWPDVNLLLDIDSKEDYQFALQVKRNRAGN